MPLRKEARAKLDQLNKQYNDACVAAFAIHLRYLKNKKASPYEKQQVYRAYQQIIKEAKDLLKSDSFWLEDFHRMWLRQVETFAGGYSSYFSFYWDGTPLTSNPLSLNQQIRFCLEQGLEINQVQQELHQFLGYQAKKDWGKIRIGLDYVLQKLKPGFFKGLYYPLFWGINGVFAALLSFAFTGLNTDVLRIAVCKHKEPLWEHCQHCNDSKALLGFILLQQGKVQLGKYLLEKAVIDAQSKRYLNEPILLKAICLIKGFGYAVNHRLAQEILSQLAATPNLKQRAFFHASHPDRVQNLLQALTESKEEKSLSLTSEDGFIDGIKLEVSSAQSKTKEEPKPNEKAKLVLTTKKKPVRHESKLGTLISSTIAVVVFIPKFGWNFLTDKCRRKPQTNSDDAFLFAEKTPEATAPIKTKIKPNKMGSVRHTSKKNRSRETSGVLQKVKQTPQIAVPLQKYLENTRFVVQETKKETIPIKKEFSIKEGELPTEHRLDIHEEITAVIPVLEHLDTKAESDSDSQPGATPRSSSSESTASQPGNSNTNSPVVRESPKRIEDKPKQPLPQLNLTAATAETKNKNSSCKTYDAAALLKEHGYDLKELVKKIPPEIKSLLTVCKLTKTSGPKKMHGGPIGGATRGLLLGKEDAVDWDLSINIPEEVLDNILKEKYKDNHKKIKGNFPVWKLDFNKKLLVDISYFLSYHQSLKRNGIFYDAEAIDPKTRNFTINAILFEQNGWDWCVHDLSGCGIPDLKNKIIRAIEPDKMFPFDPIRMLQAFYFKHRLGFNIEPVTLQAIHKWKDEILDLAKGNKYLLLLKFILKILQLPNHKECLQELEKEKILPLIVEALAKANCQQTFSLETKEDNQELLSHKQVLTEMFAGLQAGNINFADKGNLILQKTIIRKNILGCVILRFMNADPEKANRYGMNSYQCCDFYIKDSNEKKLIHEILKFNSTASPEETVERLSQTVKDFHKAKFCLNSEGDIYKTLSPVH